MRKKILLIGGSLNQTKMMHQVAVQLPEFECWFSPYFGDGLIQAAAEKGLLDFSIFGGKHMRATQAFLKTNNLQVDYKGQRNRYDLVVTCSDLIVPRNIRHLPIVLVQEGMMTPENIVYHIVRRLGLPRYLGNTSMTGLSHAYVKFCVASEGFKALFVRKGIAPKKIEVTGIPNFDNLGAIAANDFPHRDFVLGATSCLRESGQFENRRAFIRKVLDVAAGQAVIFKLHPDEKHPAIGRYPPDCLQHCCRAGIGIRGPGFGEHRQP